jgi:hypothetical protein
MPKKSEPKVPYPKTSKSTVEVEFRVDTAGIPNSPPYVLMVEPGKGKGDVIRKSFVGSPITIQLQPGTYQVSVRKELSSGAVNTFVTKSVTIPAVHVVTLL